jgi:hypothetical protein
LLATEDHADRRALAARVDQLWVHNKRSVNDTIAAVGGHEEEGAVAAVRHQPSIAKKKPPPFKKAGNGGAKRLSPEDQATMDESGPCWYHFSLRSQDLPQTLHVAGKLGGRASLNAVMSRPAHSSTWRTTFPNGDSSATQELLTVSSLITQQLHRRAPLFMAPQAGPSNVGGKKSSLFPLTKNNTNRFFC